MLRLIMPSNLHIVAPSPVVYNEQLPRLIIPLNLHIVAPNHVVYNDQVAEVDRSL